jgi:NADH:ubiquinone oxidoreductase subunit E
MSEAVATSMPANPNFPALRARLEPEFKAILAQYEETRSALLPIIRRFQDEEGYVSREALAACADILGIPVSAVESTVSFYTLFFRRPVGKYMLQVCRGMGCTINNAAEIHQYFRDALGVASLETTEDGMFSYEEVECLAACDRATCMQVNLEFVYDLDKEKIDAMLAAMRAGTFEVAPLPQTVKAPRSWHVAQDTGKKSPGAVGVSNPNSAGGVGDRAGREMLKRIVEELPEIVARSNERVVRDASQTEKRG